MCSIDELCEAAGALGAPSSARNDGGRIVDVVEYRDGPVIDVVRQVGG